MALSPANMYADLLRHDLCAFIHRSFLELEQSTFHLNWHLEVLAAKLEDVRQGCCKRLIVNVPNRNGVRVRRAPCGRRHVRDLHAQE
jgi:hypothetical protein